MFSDEIAEYVEEFRQKTSDHRVVTQNTPTMPSRVLMGLQDSICVLGVLGGGNC